MKGKDQLLPITNVNKGLCHRRVQEEKPPYFVNFREGGENVYLFYAIPSIRESVYQKVLTAKKAREDQGKQ